MTAATLQNSGSSFAETKVRPPRGPGAGKEEGGLNAPAVTVCANLIAVSGSLRAVRLSHVAATLQSTRHLVPALTILPSSAMGAFPLASGQMEPLPVGGILFKGFRQQR